MNQKTQNHIADRNFQDNRVHLESQFLYQYFLSMKYLAVIS